MTGDKKVPTKIIGDYGESLVLAHEYLRTKDKSKRQHLINKIPTPLGVGYDIQSIEIEKKKRFIEVKTTKSRKAITNNRFKLTPNEWDTAETLGEHYFIYYLVVNDTEKNIFVIQNPVKQHNSGNLKIDKNLVVEFSKTSGQWQKLIEIENYKLRHNFAVVVVWTLVFKAISISLVNIFSVCPLKSFMPLIMIVTQLQYIIAILTTIAK
jgi:hypothetical protein